jgi:hypothetical protein
MRRFGKRGICQNKREFDAGVSLGEKEFSFFGRVIDPWLGGRIYVVWYCKKKGGE